eukprot:s4063_g4.t1
MHRWPLYHQPCHKSSEAVTDVRPCQDGWIGTSIPRQTVRGQRMDDESNTKLRARSRTGNGAWHRSLDIQREEAAAGHFDLRKLEVESAKQNCQELLDWPRSPVKVLLLAPSDGVPPNLISLQSRQDQEDINESELVI